MADHGIKLEPRASGKHPYTLEEDKTIAKGWKEGKTITEIAESLETRSYNSVMYRVRFLQGKIKTSKK